MHIKRDAPKIHSVELVDAIFSQPYVRIGDLVRLGVAQRQTASVYLKDLVRLGILTEEKSAGKRSSGTGPISTCCPPRSTTFPPTLGAADTGRLIAS